MSFEDIYCEDGSKIRTRFYLNVYNVACGDEKQAECLVSKLVEKGFALVYDSQHYENVAVNFDLKRVAYTPPTLVITNQEERLSLDQFENILEEKLRSASAGA